jgi:hypothetical protein
LYRQTGELLRLTFGERVQESPHEPAYFVGLGRIGVRVNVEPVGDGDAVLELYAWIAQGLSITPAIGVYLARRNVELRFGSLCIDGEDAIILQHALFSEAVSGVILERLVRVMAESAEALDDELKARFA